MKETQEPKYNVNAAKQLYNRETGNIIPEDEPVFILRARDIHAVATLRYYYSCCIVEGHKDTVIDRIASFNLFAQENPDRMREPGEERLKAKIIELRERAARLRESAVRAPTTKDMREEQDAARSLMAQAEELEKQIAG